MRIVVLLLGLFLFAAPVSTPAEDAPLEEIVVTGEFPGPGMWKVTRSDDAASHVLWIVGEPPPLPKRLHWKSTTVEAVAASAQEILRDSTVSMEPDEKVGMFRGLSLVPAALKARRNPDDGKLEEQVPPEIYARWRAQKLKYMRFNESAEDWRPMFAGEKLRREAFDALDLRDSGMVWERLSKLVKQKKIKTTAPTILFTFKASELRATIKKFSREALDDVACFDANLKLVEALSDRDTENARAHAWATADLETLAALPQLPNPSVPCALAVMSSQVARDVIPADIREQLYALWIETAVKSLAANQTTLAVVPFAKLTRDGGYLARLRDLGYLIEAPR